MEQFTILFNVLTPNLQSLEILENYMNIVMTGQCTQYHYTRRYTSLHPV